MPTILEAAIRFGKQGLRVFPVDRATKAPLVEHGFEDASEDPDVIEDWWHRYPQANVALDIPVDRVVIDVDPRNGGLESVEALKEQGYIFPRTTTVKTPGGGEHWHYSVSESVTLKGKVAPGIDVKRGGKGYVLMPPSLGPPDVGRNYTWSLLQDELTPIPSWLLDMIRKDPRPELEPSELPNMFPFQGGTTYGLAALERTLGRIIVAPEGERNNELNRGAFGLGQLIGGGELREEHVLEQVYLTAERIGLEPEETEATINSGIEAGRLDPRTAPATVDLTAPGPVLGEDELDEAGDTFWMDWDIDEPKVEFLFPPIIPRNAYVLVYGPTEASKTMVLQWMTAHLSREGKRTTYYSLENPGKVDRDRMRRLGPDPRNFRITQRPMNLADPVQLEALVERDKGQDIIVLDTYSHVFDAGGIDGDKNEKAIAFARIIRYIMRRTGATVILVDHTGFDLSGGEPRGASAKRQQCDVAVLMMKRGNWIKGQPAGFSMENKKSSRFANPFDLKGAIHDGDGNSLYVKFLGEFMMGQQT